MKKPTVFVHPSAKPHVHDSIPGYENLVPFSKYGLEHSCAVVRSPLIADIVYCGQLSDEWVKNPTNIPLDLDFIKNSVIDIEGDWLGCQIPVPLFDMTLTINGAQNYLKKFGVNHFVRPTFSKNFVNICRTNKREDFGSTVNRSFGFKGFPDPHGVRVGLRNALSITGLPCEYKFTTKWNGPAEVGSDTVKEYEELMLRHSFSLCPRGAGHDSVRFFESCYYGRVPIVIGDNILFEDEEASKFTFKINTYMTEQEVAVELQKIFQIPDSEIIERGRMAREYFDIHVRDYIRNPTEYFLRWFLGD